MCEELEAIFQGSDRPPTMTDLKEMKYLERVIKEVMRLHPVAPIIGRKVTEDVEIGKQCTSSHCVCLNLFVGILQQ